MKFTLYYFETEWLEFEWHELGSFDTLEAATAAKELDKINGGDYRYRIKREETVYEGK